jgi:uncharacterized protein YggE
VSPRTLHTALVLAVLSPLAGATAALGQQAALDEPGIWIADARGSLQQVPTAARSFLRQDAAGEPVQLVLSVESFAESATGALSAGELAVLRVRRALSASGVSAASVSSELAFLEPRYRYRILPGSWERPIRLGFDAGYLVTVQGAGRARLGRIVDSAIGAGATRVLSLGGQVQP